MVKGPSIGGVSRQLEKNINRRAKGLRVAGARAINKTITSVRQASSVEVRKTLNLKASFVKRLLTVRKAKAAFLSGSIDSKYVKAPAIQFGGVRQTKKGVSVRLRKDQPRKLFKGAFIATMPNGHKGVFRRSLSATRFSKGRPTTSSPNLKISELHGPSVQQIFAEKQDKLVALGSPIFNRNLNREIEFELSK